jgi:hypothetical protein
VDDAVEIAPTLSEEPEPILEEESSPPSMARRVGPAALVAAAVVVATAVATSLVLSSGGHSAPAGLKALMGRVMAQTSVGAILSVDPASGASERFPVLADGGPLTPVAVSSDGQAVLDAAGTVFDVEGARIVTGSRAVSKVLSNSTAPTSSAPFADQNQAVLVLTRLIAGSPAAATLVRLSDGQEFDLGTVDSAGGDAQALGAFVSVPAQLHQSQIAHPAGPDTEVDLLIASMRPEVLATSSQLNGYVDSLPSTPIQLEIDPSPSGDAIAVLLNPLSPVTGNVPMVVLDRQGHLLAALTDRAGPIYGTQPIWSPGGREIAYPTYTNTGAALAVATETGTVQDLSAPTANTTIGQCVWSPNSTDVLCQSRSANRDRWVYATPTSDSLISAPSPGSPLAWTTADG